MHGNGAWQRAEFLFVLDDHSGPMSVGSGARCEPPLGVTQALIDAVEFTAGQQQPCVRVAQYGPVAEQFIRQRIKPAAQRDILFSASECGPLQLDQISRVPEVWRRQRVTDR